MRSAESLLAGGLCTDRKLLNEVMIRYSMIGVLMRKMSKECGIIEPVGKGIAAQLP